MGRNALTHAVVFEQLTHQIEDAFARPLVRSRLIAFRKEAQGIQADVAVVAA